MIDVMDLSIKNKSILLSNLSFDHPLSFPEMNDLINMLSSGVLIGQIYFKDSIDIDSIEKIKLLLEGLPNIDDSKIEKYIMKSISGEEKEKLCNMSFQNIDTWNIAYSVDKNKFSVTSLSKYRLIDEWFTTSIKEMNDSELSTIEKICYLYDKVKLFQFNSCNKYSRLPEILSLGEANSYGYNLVFSELLSLCGIPNFIGKYEIDSEISYVTIAQVDDSKYDVDGIYLFDPSMDTISKDKYKHGLARRMNYNFFALDVNKFCKLNGEVVFLDETKLLFVEDEFEYKHCLNKYKSKNGMSNIRKVENTFGYNFNELRHKVCNSSSISLDVMSKLFEKSVDNYSKNSNEKDLIVRTIMNNYVDREGELFDSSGVKLMTKKELICA